MASIAQFRGTYSSCLRDHPVWRTLGPILASESMHESGSKNTFDLRFNLIHQSTTVRLDVLLVSPACLASMRESTLARIGGFISRTTVPAAAVIFLFPEDTDYSVDDYLTLQVHLAQYLPTVIPLIPVHNSSQLVECIRAYMESMMTSRSLPLPKIDALAVLPSMADNDFRADEPNTDGIWNVLFPSLRSLSQAARTEQGLALLDAYFGEEGANEIAGFLYRDKEMA